MNNGDVFITKSGMVGISLNTGSPTSVSKGALVLRAPGGNRLPSGPVFLSARPTVNLKVIGSLSDTLVQLGKEIYEIHEREL